MSEEIHYIDEIAPLTEEQWDYITRWARQQRSRERSMATITQSIATLEQQLRELVYDDGTSVFEHVYAYPVIPDKTQTPCATIEAATSTRVTVTVYIAHRADEVAQAEKRITEIADICGARWDIQGQFGRTTSAGTIYRTFRFGLACG